MLHEKCGKGGADQTFIQLIYQLQRVKLCIDVELGVQGCGAHTYVFSSRAEFLCSLSKSAIS